MYSDLPIESKRKIGFWSLINEIISFLVETFTKFILLFKKPTLYFENNEKIHNIEFNNYSDLITIDQKVKESFGYTFKKENIKDLDILMNKSILEFTNKDAKIKDFIDKNFYNYGSTVENFNDLINKDL